MKNLSLSQPIGIFDSGIGGLSVAHALVQALPQENIIYFGDTAHFPYGNRSHEALQNYAVRISQMLLDQACKMIVIACNTASASAFEVVRKYVGDKAIVIDVIEPTIDLLHRNYAQQTIGLIATKQTVESNVYRKKLDEKITLKQHATPFLASAIEARFKNQKIIEELLIEYLNHANLNDISALILGCTHYPLIKNQVKQFYQQKSQQVDLIDCCDIVAECVKQVLSQHQLMNQSGGERTFYVSDYTEAFAEMAQLFFGEFVKLEHYPLWE